MGLGTRRRLSRTDFVDDVVNRDIDALAAEHAIAFVVSTRRGDFVDHEKVGHFLRR